MQGCYLGRLVVGLMALWWHSSPSWRKKAPTRDPMTYNCQLGSSSSAGRGQCWGSWVTPPEFNFFSPYPFLHTHKQTDKRMHTHTHTHTHHIKYIAKYPTHWSSTFSNNHLYGDKYFSGQITSHQQSDPTCKLKESQVTWLPRSPAI